MERFEGELRRETPSATLRALRFAWFILTSALVPIFYLGNLPSFAVSMIGLSWLIGSAVTAQLMVRFAKKTQQEAVYVVLDATGLLIGDTLAIPRSAIVSSATHSLPDGSLRILIHRKPSAATLLSSNRCLSLITNSPQTGRALLTALRGDAEHCALRISLPSRPSAAMSALGIVGFITLATVIFTTISDLTVAPAPAANAIISLCTAAIVLGCTYSAFARTIVSVGLDGIELRTGLRKRFINIDRVRQARPSAKGLRIELTDGETIIVAAPSFIDTATDLDAFGRGTKRTILAERISEALRAHRARTRSRNRPAETWLAVLRASANLGAYRVAPAPVDELRELVSDSSAARDTRVMAAIALRVADGAEAAVRIRVAAETSAAPELRTALIDVAEATQDGDLERCLARTRPNTKS